MNKKILLLTVSVLCRLSTAFSQGVVDPALLFLEKQIDTLSSPAMLGRGYAKDGVAKASAYIQAKFSEFGLKPLHGGSYTQTYYFPVNTFPDKMTLSINGKLLQPGADYIIDAHSPSFSAQNMEAQVVDMAAVKDTKELRNVTRTFDNTHAWILLNFDSCFKMLHEDKNAFIAALPGACYIIPQTAKLTWDVSRDTMDATVFYVKHASVPVDANSVSCSVRARYIPHYRNENIVGYVPGAVKDSFVVFSAHYDHLGMMGENAMFPGASDNASGTAMMLYLASYFSTHPSHYSVLFIAFSGEEIGLLGSAFFVAHPMVPLAKIKFLTNIDIMGDATDGVTVVNATEFPEAFKLLQTINDQNKYLPGVYSRGKAANSDHYFFTEAGVPSFFIYSNGGKGFYHDIYDTGPEVTLNHVDGMVKLMIDFMKEIH